MAVDDTMFILEENGELAKRIRLSLHKRLAFSTGFLVQRSPCCEQDTSFPS